MTPDIITKLNDCLGIGNYSEHDVVYFLVQSYKLLERERQKDNFPALLFYRNWACHAALYGYKEVFRLVIKENQDGFGSFECIDLAADQIVKSFSNYSFNKLKDDINSFIKGFIKSRLPSKSLNWESFREKLYEIIKDIPLIVKDGDKEVFRFECRELLKKGNFDDLRIGVEMGNVSFEFHSNDGTL